MMPSIESFREIRIDGNIILPSMSPAEITARWGRGKIVEIQWINGNRTHSRRAALGISAQVVSGDEFIVVNEAKESQKDRIVEILNADGSSRFVLPSKQAIRGSVENGQYLWFEKPRTNSPHTFGVVFERDRDNSQFQLDINAVDGTVVGEYPTR